MKYVRVFLALRFSMKLLLLEALIFLAWARILKAIPFAKVAPSLGERSGVTPPDPLGRNEALAKDISRAIRMVSRHTFWESKCLVMAIAAMKMLARRNIESTMYLGTARDDSGKMIAHAWLRSGRTIITGAEGMSRFTVVETFGKRVS